MNKTAAIILLTGLFFLFPATGRSQQSEFAPIGSEWYHNMNWGVFHSTVPNDTVINGITCRHVAVRPQVNRQPSPPIWSEYDFYFYNTDDTVFFYNRLFQRFTPLYVFNVNAGDTVVLPVFHPDGPYFLVTPRSPDSCFRIVVDSVVFKPWDKDTLKTIYTHEIGDPMLTSVFSFDGPYAKKLGGIQAGLVPNCKSCAAVLADNYQSIGWLRCYHEANSALSVELVDTCEGHQYKEGIHHWKGEAVTVRVYPNPGSDKINISFRPPSATPERIDIFNLQGQRVYRLLPKNIRQEVIPIDASSFPPGLYFLKIACTSGQVINKKFSKI